MSFSSLAVQGLQQTAGLLSHCLINQGKCLVLVTLVAIIIGVADSASANDSLVQYLDAMKRSTRQKLASRWKKTLSHFANQDDIALIPKLVASALSHFAPLDIHPIHLENASFEDHFTFKSFPPMTSESFPEKLAALEPCPSMEDLVSYYNVETTRHVKEMKRVYTNDTVAAAAQRFHEEGILLFQSVQHRIARVIQHAQSDETWSMPDGDIFA